MVGLVKSQKNKDRDLTFYFRLKKKKKSHLILWNFRPPIFLIQTERTLFVTRDVRDGEKIIPRELLFEVVQLKDESQSQYSFPGSETFSTFFFFFPTANTRKTDGGSGNVSNRLRDDGQKCNHPIGSKGKYSFK